MKLTVQFAIKIWASKSLPKAILDPIPLSPVWSLDVYELAIAYPWIGRSIFSHDNDNDGDKRRKDAKYAM